MMVSLQKNHKVLIYIRMDDCTSGFPDYLFVGVIATNVEKMKVIKTYGGETRGSKQREGK